MFRIHNTITIDLRPLEAYKRRFRNPKSPQMKPVMQKWRARYVGYIRRRFVSQSRGGGDWPSLAPATKRSRRKGKGSGSPATLRDTGTLMGVLDAQRTDNWKFIRNGVRVGFLKGTRNNHPGGKRNVGVSDIAAIHQFGKGHNPKREIIVDPDTATTQGMIRDLMRAAK
ncbi:MAG: hypothetical protein JKX85_00145 [Phycisphaeraceae bacterium]|nr:hypothetical protein [Phycisphaeraceae bacterium]